MAPATLRAKFRCFDVRESEDGKSQTVQLHAVMDGAPENKKWAEATPSGNLSMCITNTAAFGVFATSKEYFLDVVPADADPFAELDKPLPEIKVDDLLDEGERIPKAGDEVKAAVGDTEVTPPIDRDTVIAAVCEKLPDAEYTHVEEAVHGHVDAVEMAVANGEKPVDTEVHQEAVDAAMNVGASKEDAVAIASAIPVVVAAIQADAPSVDGAPVAAVAEVKEPEPVADTDEEKAAKDAAAEAVKRATSDRAPDGVEEKVQG